MHVMTNDKSIKMLKLFISYDDAKLLSFIIKNQINSYNLDNDTKRRYINFANSLIEETE